MDVSLVLASYSIECTLYIYASVKRLTSLKETVKGNLFLKFDVSQYKPAVIVKSDKKSSSPWKLHVNAMQLLGSGLDFLFFFGGGCIVMLLCLCFSALLLLNGLLHCY